MYQILTLDEIKSWLKITDTTVDDFLLTLQGMATSVIEQYIDKYIITRHISAEFHNGNHSSLISATQYPIYKVVNLYDDTEHDYGDDSLIATTDYTVDYDIGVIRRLDGGVFYRDVHNVKIDYWAGLSRFLVVDEQNNYLDITDPGGTASVEIPVQSLYSGDGYNAEDLATAIQTALNADSTLSATYEVVYNHQTQKFTISADNTFEIPWANNNAKSIASLLGFTANDADGTSYTSDVAVTGVPKDLVLAAKQLIDLLYDQSKQGHSIQNIKKKIMPAGGGTYEYLTDDLPPVSQAILNKYKRAYL